MSRCFTKSVDPHHFDRRWGAMANRISAALALSWAIFWACPAQADIVFTEEFMSDASGWTDFNNQSNLITHNAAGGPDGSSFISTVFNLANGGSMGTTLFRAHVLNTPVPSGGQFAGNYLPGGKNLESLSFFVRHDSPTPLPFFVRFATPGNFPASVAGPGTLPSLAAIPGNNVWTQVTIPILPSSFVHEAGNFASNFANIGNVQIGTGGTSGNVTFGLDKIAISAVPEPSTGLLTSVAVLMLSMRRRRV